MKRIVTVLGCLLLLLFLILIQLEAVADIQKPPMDHFTVPPINTDIFATPKPTLIRPTMSIRTINPDILATPTPTLIRPTKPVRTINPD